MSESVLPMFSSRSFIVSGLTFISLIHFEFIFVYGVRKCSRFILLQVVDQFSHHHLLKRLETRLAFSKEFLRLSDRYMGFLNDASGKESARQCRRRKRHGFDQDPLKESMAPHSSILAWRIPWIEEPSRLQSMGLQKIRHDLASKQQQ